MKKYIRILRNFFFILLLVNLTDIVLSAQGSQKSKMPKRNKAAEDTKKLDNSDEDVTWEHESTSFGQEDAETKAKRKELLKLELENSLVRLRLERELAALRVEIEKLRTEKEMFSLKWDIEQEKSKKESQKIIEGLNQKRDEILAELAFSQAQFSKTIEGFNKQYAKAQNELSLARVQADQLRTEIDAKKVQQERSLYAEGGASYLDEPLQKDGKLIISDRKINLTGVIVPWKANYIVDQISYFNNKDPKKPIFLVIDSSPGGSGHAMFQIVQAMKNSQAPVHVVVQSFAASAAAVITTLAKKSYIYPNASILHHQPWTFMWGNIREIKEELALMQEYWKRCGGEIAKKMGISLAELDKKLYEKSARGDWEEFGDNATKIRWVDHVTNHLYDTGFRLPVDAANYTWRRYYEGYYYETPVEQNKIGNGCEGKVLLPALAANDFYYLYNPNNIYQVIGFAGK